MTFAGESQAGLQVARAAVGRRAHTVQTVQTYEEIS